MGEPHRGDEDLRDVETAAVGGQHREQVDRAEPVHHLPSRAELQERAANALQNPHRREAVPMQIVQQGIHNQGELENSHGSSPHEKFFKADASMPRVPQAVSEFDHPAAAYSKPHHRPGDATTSAVSQPRRPTTDSASFVSQAVPHAAVPYRKS